MAGYELVIVLFSVVQVFFAFAFGACIGSLVNVLVYRLPLGLSVVTPPSRCPSCSSLLTWRENIPVFGWLFLKGKCRFCKCKISPEYPIVEAFVGVLFAAMYALFYMVPHGAMLWGIPIGHIQPEWALNGFGLSWASFIVMLVLLSCLVAMTLVDAKTCTIPLVLAWVPAIVAVVLHPLWALFLQLSHKVWFVTARDEIWSMTGPGLRGWWGIGASIGGILGLAIANFLLEKCLIPRSFADYEEWETKAHAETAAAQAVRAAQIAPGTAVPDTPLSESGPRELHEPHEPTDMWIQYPHARREMGKEIVFLTPCIVLGFAGGGLAHWLAGPWTLDPINFVNRPVYEAPLWLAVLAAVLMGYIIGGGIVWLFRIAGSLGFGKEAIGLGDVHLLAAVGACMGWVDAVLAFFLSAFVGVFLAVLRRLAAGKFKRAMPFGPCLAIATLLVILFKPLIEMGLTRMLRSVLPVDLP